MQKKLKNKFNRMRSRVQRKVKYLGQNPTTKIKEIFDADYYKSQLNYDYEVIDLIDHFYRVGWKDRKNPHPLFSIDYYLDQSPDVVKSEINPVVHFLNWGVFELRNPHPLFSTSFYIAQAPGLLKQNQNPLLHYLKFGAKSGINPHPLFDTSFYLQRNPDIDVSGMNPLYHFVCFGYKEGCAPHPLFSTEFYQSTYLDQSDDNPLIHYLDNPANDPHPWFRTDHYLKHNQSIKVDEINPLIHFLHGKRYTDKTRHISNTKFTPVHSQPTRPDKPLLYLVSHDASRTGAPAIILNIARFFSQLGRFDLVIFMHKGGPLLEEFQELGSVVNFEEIGEFQLDNKVLEVLTNFSINQKPILAIVNSAESSYFTNLFGENQISVLTLIHEYLTFYPKDLVHKIIKNSQNILFPSHYIKQIALDHFDIDKRQYAIISQGLLNPEFGKLDVETARKQIRKDCNLPQNAFVVLCCGAGHLRKGFDLFIQIAAHYQRLYCQGDVYFLWVGEPNENNMFTYFMERDIERLGLQKNFIFLGEREDVEPFFVGSDVFFLSSREDPFPCVIHEAMAAALPIIVFENSGGATESIADTGIIVPFADFEAAAEAIFKLYLNPELRERLGEMAKTRVQTQYNFHHYCYSIANYIQKEMGINLGISIPDFAERKPVVKRQPSHQERLKYYDSYNLREKFKFKNNSKIDPVFIAGTTRSGTSIMKLGLRMVYGHVDANEGHLWPLYKEIWDTVERYLEKNKATLNHPNSLALTGRESLCYAIFNMFHNIHMGGNDGRVFADKSPNDQLINSLPLIQSLYPNMRVIYMVRHGVNNIESKIRKFPDVTFEQHCKNWARSIEAWFIVRGSLKTYLEIDQAELLLEPAKIVDTTKQFLGLNGQEHTLLLHTFSERVIEQTSKAKKVNTLLKDTTWDEWQKDTFEKICSDTMKKCKYVY